MTGTGGAPLGALPGGLGHDALAGEVRRALGWLGEGSRAGLALSGGGDSVALAHLVPTARPDLGLVVLTVRHGFRDDRPDVAVAAAIATRLGVPFVELDVAVAPDRRTGLEAAARQERFDALAAAARERDLDAVLLAHTADDQAETVLLNIGRGAGTGGLGGMPARRVHAGVAFARPLLRARRADLRAVATARGWTWVEDPMNADPHYRRIQVRQTLLPALAALSGGPGDPVALLTRLADLARDDAAALDELAAEAASRLVVAWGPVRALRVDALQALRPALARRVVRRVLATVRGGTAGLPAAAVEAALRLGPGQAVDVAGGVRATCGGGWLAAAPADLPALPWRPLPAAAAVDLPALPWRPLPAAAAVDLPEIGARLCVAPTGRPAPAEPLVPPCWPPVDTAAPDATAYLPEVCEAGVRGWRAGDRLGTERGDRPVADLLTRAGVPRPVRPLVPVVVDAAGCPLWVTGVATAPAARAGRRRVWLAAGPGRPSGRLPGSAAV